MPNRTMLGHVHLKVHDLDRSIRFYAEVLNFHVTESLPGKFAFLSGGETHHELALQQVPFDAPAPPPWGVGLYHIAFEVPDRLTLGNIYRKLQGMGVRVTTVDHRISWALYFNDPDGIGLEVYYDRRNNDDGTAQWHGQSRYLDPVMLVEDGGMSSRS